MWRSIPRGRNICPPGPPTLYEESRGIAMKIKLAILEKDRSYLSRVVTAFGTKYAEKLEIYSFTDPDVALATLNSAKIDVLLASDAFEIDAQKLPNRCAFAYLIDSMGIESYNDQRAICKFQKADLIYKQILSIYSENAHLHRNCWLHLSVGIHHSYDAGWLVQTDKEKIRRRQTPVQNGALPSSSGKMRLERNKSCYSVLCGYSAAVSGWLLRL